MSSQNRLSLEEAIQAFQQEVELVLLSTTKDIVKDVSKQVAYGLQVEYDDFFAELLEIVRAKLEWAPKILRKYIQDGEWDNLSEPWEKAKQKFAGMPYGQQWYYNGLSGKRTLGVGLSIRKNDGGVRRLGNKTRRSTKKILIPPFRTYIESLQAVGTTEKFFGPVTLQYEFQAPALGHKITPVMGARVVNGELVDNVITKINHRTRKGTFGKIEGNLAVTAHVQAFGVLKDVQKTEWMIVDYILKRVDSANEKQWVKINGTRGPGKKGGKRGSEGRKIRPIILPLIQYYINEALPQAMRNNVR